MWWILVRNLKKAKSIFMVAMDGPKSLQYVPKRRVFGNLSIKDSPYERSSKVALLTVAYVLFCIELSVHYAPSALAEISCKSES